MKNQQHKFGNASASANETPRNGWFIGAFMPPYDVFHHSQDVEIKWADHRKGEAREGWSQDDNTHTVSILIKGHFKLIFTDISYELKKRGDYVIWKPGTTHTWQALSDSTILTVRWPSIGAS